MNLGLARTDVLVYVVSNLGKNMYLQSGRTAVITGGRQSGKISCNCGITGESEDN